MDVYDCQQTLVSSTEYGWRIRQGKDDLYKFFGWGSVRRQK